MALSVTDCSLMIVFILSVWFIPMSLSQNFVPAQTRTEERLLGCNSNELTSSNIELLGSITEPSNNGTLPLRLRNETYILFRPGHPLFTRYLPIIQILGIRTICSSRSTSGYSSLSVLIKYTCLGLPCTRNIFEVDSLTRTYTHFFSLFCVGENTWHLQNHDEVASIGFGGNYTRSHSNKNILNPEIAQDGKCIVCTTDGKNVAKFTPQSSYTYNPNTGCVSCPTTCESGSCLTAVNTSKIDLKCCRFVLSPGFYCVHSCGLAYYSVITSTEHNTCQQVALLQREGDKRQFCSNDVIRYNCSSAFFGNTASLVWDITGNVSETITYSKGSRIGVVSEYMNFNTVLTEYTHGEYLASTLSIIVNTESDHFEVGVSCTIDSLSPVIDTIQSPFLREVPLVPTGFRSTQQFQISVDVTNITFEWDFPPGDTVDHYELITYPNALSPSDDILTSPITVSLLPYRIHTATLTAVNCIGKSLPITTEVVTLGPEVLIVNEDAQEISVTSLQVTADSGDVAPNLQCVSSNQTTSLEWSKVEGFPCGFTVSNGSALFGQAIKLDFEKRVHFTDSGTYVCTATTNETIQVLEIELTVLQFPFITSVFPNSPTVKQVTSNVFDVPNGYSGVIFTCNVIGWPPPNIVWLSNLDNDNASNDSTSDLVVSGYSSVQLLFPSGINEGDSGVYTCFASGNSTVTHSVLIVLQVTTGMIPRYSDPQCSVNSATVFFQLQVQHTDCLNWEQDTIERVVIDTRDAVIGGIFSQCEECIITGDTIIAIRQYLCSDAYTSSGVVLFSGEITTINKSMTSDMLCGLSAWHRTLPLTLINSELIPIAPDCRLQVKPESLANPSFCTAAGATTIIISVLTVVLVMLILMSVGVFIVLRQMGMFPGIKKTLDRIIPTTILKGIVPTRVRETLKGPIIPPRVKAIFKGIIPTSIKEIFKGMVPTSIKEIFKGIGPIRAKEIIKGVIPTSIKVVRGKRKETIYEDADFPEDYNPFTQDNQYTNINRRSMYDDVETVYVDALD